jgi:transcriptional regulator with XRE-family HTH domain
MSAVNSIAATALAKRKALNLSQTEIALRAGVSRKWVSEFERGKAEAELGLTLRLLDALELAFTVGEKAERERPKIAGKNNSTTRAKKSLSLIPIDLDAAMANYR